MSKADIVIIGAGVIGSSVAYHLALKGYKNILVIDKGPSPGAGSTGRAVGGFRCQFGTEINIRLSLLARQKLLCFQDELGIDSGYRPYGYMFLAHHDSALIDLRKTLLVQQKLGLTEAREINTQDAQDLNPAISTEGIVGGVFCPSDGFIRPLQILKGYMEGAKRLGVRFEFGIDCQGLKTKKINPSQSEISHLLTNKDSIATELVINAAGAWASEITKDLDLQLPVEAISRQVAVVAEDQILPEQMPMTIFVEDGFHFRVRDGKVLLMMPSAHQSSAPQVESSWIQQVSQRAKQQIPILRKKNIDHHQSWAGLYESSPDKHAILGQAAHVKNLYLVNGSSGHGVMHSPALGQLLAELICGEQTSVDIHALRSSRFAENAPNPSTDFL